MSQTDYIMDERMFNNLSCVNGFNQYNGSTYNEHILIIAGSRIPSHLHKGIIEATDAAAALGILTANDISFCHS